MRSAVWRDAGSSCEKKLENYSAALEILVVTLLNSRYCDNFIIATGKNRHLFSPKLCVCVYVCMSTITRNLII